MSDDEAASRYARRGQERSPHPFGGAGFFTAPLVHFGRLVVSFVIGG